MKQRQDLTLYHQKRVSGCLYAQYGLNNQPPVSIWLYTSKEWHILNGQKNIEPCRDSTQYIMWRTTTLITA